MRGTPKHLNTKADYMNVINDASIPDSYWRGKLQALLDTRHDWFFVSALNSAEAGITDATHKVVVSNDTDGDGVTYSQYELRENPNSEMHRLGFIEEEVVMLLA